MPNLAKDKLCTGCLACKDACPKSAIKIVLRNGLTHIAVDSNVCVDCKLCEKVCPIVSPVRKNEVLDMRAYGGWAKNFELRHNGASGGAFAGLAQSFIQQHKDNVAVYGAALRDNNVKHERITLESEISVLMNSKYIQSLTDGIYGQVRSDLKNGLWVLFSGTPCQVAALYGFLGKNRDCERLITVEIVCHGVPGKEALDIHLEHYNSSKIYSFRDKKNGQKNSQYTTIERNGEPYRFVKRQEDLFYKIFSGCLLDRKSCSNCMYASINRVADVTLADFWGGVRNANEYDEGVNVIIANNHKGVDFVENADGIDVYRTTLLKAFCGNPRMLNGFKFIQYHPFVLFPKFFRKVLPRKIWLQVVENRMPWKLIWAPFRLLTKEKNKIVKKNIEKKYGSLLNKWVLEKDEY